MPELKQLFDKYYDSNIAGMEEFYFSKAQEALQSWRALRIEDSLLDKLMKLNYDDFNKLAESDPTVKTIREKIFKLVSYCDLNASEKESYNEYKPCRSIAKAGIRQNAWVRQWLVFKKAPGNVAESISNVINYIEHPESNFPIVSEDHKEQLSRNLLKIPYDKTTFASSLLRYFDDMGFGCVNSLNRTYLYSRMFYSLQDQWKDKMDVKGLVARDGTDWKTDFEADVAASSHGYGIMWRHNLPSDNAKVLKALRTLIDNGETFDFYIVENNWAKYKAVVEDFALAKDYDDVVEDWKEKDPAWFCEKFTDYNSKDANGKITQQAKIAFLIRSFERIPDEDQLDVRINFKFKIDPGRINYVAYTDIITSSDIKMNKTLSDIALLASIKKNIILQGAPGTGKT